MPIGEFSLVDQGGQAYGSAQLGGKVWIADFIFTSCPSVCPLLSSQMANLHRRLRHPELRYLSITVDPETDTPEVLREYAGRYGADLSRWRFLSGEPDTVRRVVVERFRMPVSDRIPQGENYDIEHGARFMLIDRQGQLRGLYSSDRAELDRLERDARRLLEE